MSVKSSLMILGIALSTFLFSGCGAYKMTAEVPELENKEESAWYTPIMEEAQNFTNLNLDGVGENDDEVILATYCWEGSPENSYTMLSIRLGTGEVLSKGFSGRMSFLFQTGYITSLERESMVLEVSSKTSNFSASTVYVLEIGEDDGGVFLNEPVIIGDFTERPKRANCIDVPLLTIGTSISEGGPGMLDEIQLFEVDVNHPDGENIMRTLSWRESNWKHQFFYEDTTFHYGGHSYDVASHILSAFSVGEKIVLECYAGAQNGGYYIFDSVNESFEANMLGNNFIWHSDDITTTVYSLWSDVYTYNGSIIKSYDLAEHEYIFDLEFVEDNTKLRVTILRNDGSEQIDVVNLTKPLV